MFTIIRLADGASQDQACKLAGIDPSEVNLTQKMGEKTNTEHLPADFRIISFDGQQITISERVAGERKVRGFAIGEQFEQGQVVSPKPGFSVTWFLASVAEPLAAL